jgi:tetratricopeptide (TPR) repeat protein
LNRYVLRLAAAALALGVGLVGLARPALAQPTTSEESMAQATTSDQDMTDAQARAHFRLGRQAYEEGRFADAAQEFEIAYGLSGRGALLYNVYLAYRDAQDSPNAARALRGYLAAVPDAPDHDHLQARLVALEATVSADQEAEAARTAQAAEQRRQLEDAERRALEAEMRAQQGPTVSRPWWPWLVFGGGVVLAGIGGALAAVAGADADALRHSCVTQSATTGTEQPLVLGAMCSPSVNLESRRSAIMGEAAAADALWISGSIIAVTGLVLAFVLPDDVTQPSDPAAPAVSAGCGPTGCSGSVTVHF